MEQATMLVDRDLLTASFGPPEHWPAHWRAAFQLISASPHPMLLCLGPERRCVYNDGYAQLLGSGHPVALGRPFAAIWVDAAPQLSVPLEHVFATAMPTSIELATASGRRRFAFSPLPNEAGIVDAVLCTCEVLDEIQHEVDDDKLLLDTIFAHMPVGIAFFDRELRFHRINTTMAQQNGLPVDEHLGRTPEEALPIGGALLRPFLEQVRDSGEPIANFDISGPAADGSIQHSLANWFPVKQGADVALVGAVVLDITKRKEAEAALLASEARFRTLVQSTANIVWTTAPDGTFAGLQPSWERFTGQAVAEYANFGGFSPIHADDRAAVESIWRQAVQDRSLFETEYRLRRYDGEYRYVHVRSAPIIAADGSIVEWVGVGEDITERKRHELNTAFLDAISQELARLTSDQDIMQLTAERIGAYLAVDGCQFLEYDATQDLASVAFAWPDNPANTIGGSYRISAFIPAEVVATLVRGRQFVVGDIQTDVKTVAGAAQFAALDVAALVGTPYLSDGRWKASLNVSYHRAHKWRADELDLLRELTERVWARIERTRAEAALRRNQAQLIAILEQLPVGVGVTDHAGKLLLLNSTLRRYMPTFIPARDPQRRHRWRTWAADGTPLDPEQWPAIRSLRGETVVPGVEFLFAADDGRERWITLTTAPLRDEQDAIVGAIIVLQDIDERKRAEERRLDEEQRLYAQEQRARAEAEEMNRLKDEFLATVSHELRTPLTAFLGYAQMLQLRKRDEAYVARTVEKMVRNAKVQAQLIDDLLDVSRVVSGRLRIEALPINLTAVVRVALDTILPIIETKGIQLQIDLDSEAANVVGDANRLQQVAWNLLSNAAKFTPSAGVIQVQLVAEADHARLTVRDNGQGINPEFLPFVFEQFRQADSTSQRAYGGLGLGLAIVRHLVELHGGSVEASSDGPGTGATFTVRLPLASTPSEVVTQEVVTKELHLCPPELNGLRVLLVDDEIDILDLVHDVLAPCGALIRLCSSAREALEVVQSWQPDVLVSDIAMPGEDGYWLIAQLRELADTGQRVPVAAALTAYVRMEDRLRVLAAGYQLYVPKPIEPAELRTIVAQLARETWSSP
jgi:PAS domain S-box-containing protein